MTTSKKGTTAKSARRFAFLRAINVGGRTVTKERLLPVFEELGFERVESFLASGNVVFDAPSRTSDRTLARKIEAGLEQALGLKSDAFVRTGDELRSIAALSPFDEAELAIADAGGAINVTLFGQPPGEAGRAAIVALSDADNLLRFAGRELYWVSATKMSQSPLFAVSFEKLAGLPGTMRNVNTIRRLIAKYVDSA